MALSAAVIRELIAAGLEGDALVAACERIELLSPNLAAVDVQAERRRAADRERKRNNWPELRLQIFQRDNYTCAYCGKADLENPHCDHILPVSRGGINDPDNLTTSCETCNLSKGARTPVEWLSS